MSPRFTATLPDGTESRVAWFLWMLVGLLAARIVAAAVIFVEAGAEMVGFTPAGGTAATLLNVIQVLLPAALLALFVVFAERRLTMPPAVWIAIAAGPVVMWALVVRDAMAGEPPLMLSLAVPVTLATVGAWLLVRFWPTGAVGSDVRRGS